MSEKYRQEHKFLISRQSMDILKYRLKSSLRTDAHADTDGSYWIRSLYFDDADRNAYREKLDGVKERCKLRIRYYNFDDSYIVLEKKERFGDLCRKTSEVISKETAQTLINGGYSGGSTPLLNEFDALRTTRALRPIVIVDYRRYAFAYPYSDTRVTLDSQLCTPIYSTDFFDKDLLCIPVFEKDEALIEFKYDNEAPPYVSALLADIPKVKMAVSKYTKCLSMMDE